MLEINSTNITARIYVIRILKWRLAAISCTLHIKMDNRRP